MTEPSFTSMADFMTGNYRVKVIRPYEVQWQGVNDEQWYYGDSRSTVESAKAYACRLLSTYSDWIFRTRVVHVPDGVLVDTWKNPNPDAVKELPNCAIKTIAQLRTVLNEDD